MGNRSAGASEVIRRFCRTAEWNDITGLGAGCGQCYLSEPQTVADAIEQIRSFRSAGLKVQVIGAGMDFIGTDHLISDAVFMKLPRGGVFSSLSLIGETRIKAGAACSLSELVRFALEHGLGGASGLSGIPGTLGGALAMNAGAAGCCIADFVREVRMISLSAENIREFSLPPAGLGFGYRKSPFLRDNMLITGAVLEFRETDPERKRN